MELVERKHQLMREREEAVKRLEAIPREREQVIGEANARVQALDIERNQLAERVAYLAGLVDGIDSVEKGEEA